MLKPKAKSEAEKKKPGRKPSGLRDLKPEAARLSVLKAVAKLVREAEVLRKTAEQAARREGRRAVTGAGAEERPVLRLHACG
jgi:hypothetical protein